MMIFSNDNTYWWCRGDIRAEHRALRTRQEDGNAREKFYHPGTGRHLTGGPNLDLADFYHPKGPEPILDFVDPSAPFFTCKPEVLDAFDFLIAGQFRSYKIAIDDQPYVIFRPSVFLDLFDDENSTYLTSSSGTPHGFSRVRLLGAPPEGIHFFGLYGHGAIGLQTIVSDEFRKIYDSNGYTGLCFRKTKDNGAV